MNPSPHDPGEAQSMASFLRDGTEAQPMLDQFTITIDLGNAGMSKPDDVVDALRMIANDLEAEGPDDFAASTMYVAIDLDANNREAVGTFGWGVCRHGHGLQDLPPLSESQARGLAVKLNS